VRAFFTEKTGELFELDIKTFWQIFRFDRNWWATTASHVLNGVRPQTHKKAPGALIGVHNFHSAIQLTEFKLQLAHIICPLTFSKEAATKATALGKLLQAMQPDEGYREVQFHVFDKVFDIMAKRLRTTRSRLTDPTLEFPDYTSVIDILSIDQQKITSSVEQQLYVIWKKFKEGDSYPLPLNPEKHFVIPPGGFPAKNAPSLLTATKRSGRAPPPTPHKRRKGGPKPPNNNNKRRGNSASPQNKHNGGRGQGQGRTKGGRAPNGHHQAASQGHPKKHQQHQPHWAQGGQPNFPAAGRGPPRPLPQHRPQQPPGQFRNAAPQRQQGPWMQAKPAPRAPN
jgi:hypothetical protein